MALSARVPSTTKTNLFTPAIYSNKVIEAVKSDLVAWDSINTEWASGMTKGDIFYIPKTNTVTASEVVVGTAGSALNPLNTTGVTLTINLYYEAPVYIDYMSQRQTQANLDDIAATEAKYAVKKVMDTSVCDLFNDLGGYSASAYGSDGQTLTDDILVYCMETLDEADVPRDGKRALVIDPSAMADMVKIDKFVASLYVQLGAVENGLVGKNHPIYGCDIRVTNNLSAASTGAYACMLHKNAIAGKAQIDNAYRKEFEELHETLWNCDLLWGVIEAQDSFGVPFFTRKA